MVIKDLMGIKYMNKEQLEKLKFSPFTLSDGTLIMLIPKIMFYMIPNGTELISIVGTKVVKGDNPIKIASYDGYTVYGVTPAINADNKVISIKEIIPFTYFEAIHWYLNTRIHSINEKEKDSAKYFNELHSSQQGTDCRANYLKQYPLETLSYLLLFSSVSRIFHNSNRGIFEDVIKELGYNPVDGDWYEAEEFIEEELRVRMTPDDIIKVSLRIHRN